MIAAIHQPNFFPWLGYFRKMVVADVFVFLDAVQIVKKGGSWVNRVKLLMNKESQWMTAPIVRGHGVHDINLVTLNNSIQWQKRLSKTITQNYCKSPYYDELFPWVESMLNRPVESLSKFNIENVKEIVEKLNIDCQFILQSEMLQPYVFELKGSDRLAAICEAVHADTYLAGDGADTYENIDVYKSRNIRLIHNNFIPSSYHQIGVPRFIQGLSILDMFFNIGVEETCNALHCGVEDV